MPAEVFRGGERTASNVRAIERIRMSSILGGPRDECTGDILVRRGRGDESTGDADPSAEI